MQLGWKPITILVVGVCVLVLVFLTRAPKESVSGEQSSTSTAVPKSSDAELPNSFVLAAPVKLTELSDPESYEALVHQPLGRGPFPLLLYLHGAGETGGRLRNILSEGATGTPPVALIQGKALEVMATKFTMVAPHATSGWRARSISAFIDFLLSEKSGLMLDQTRMYVSGHSMGGYGALVAATTGRFAAAAPVAGSGTPRIAQLKGTPIWAFHGRNDVVVPSYVSEQLIEDLRKSGVPEHDAKLTLYDTAPAPVGWPEYDGHASTIPAYATPELYQWFLSHRLEVQQRTQGR